MTDSLSVGDQLVTRRVLIELGPVANFAAVLEAEDPAHRSVLAAREAGFAAVPAPPTYAFVMDHFGAHDDLQPIATGALAGLKEVARLLSADGGTVVHGEETFEYECPLLVGEIVDIEAEISDLSERSRPNANRMKFVTVKYVVRGAEGDLILTKRTTMICLL